MNEENKVSPNGFFSGGGGFFIEYFDIVRPIYLFIIIDMIMTNNTFGLPTDIIESMNNKSIIEWYIKRRYINPLKCLDFYNIINLDELDSLLDDYITHVPLYQVCPTMNIHKMMEIYKNDHLDIPVFIYTEKEYQHVKNDIHMSFSGINVRYLTGDLVKCLQSCGPNFTYIFSTMNALKIAVDFLKGTCAHVLLSREYRYNQVGLPISLEQELGGIMQANPFVRIGTTTSVDMEALLSSLVSISLQSKDQ